MFKKKRDAAKRRISIVRAALVPAVLFFVLVFGINAYVKSVGEKYLLTEPEAASASAGTEGYECIIVLGAGVYADGSPTPMLEDRLVKAYELYEEGVAPKVLITGDNGQIEYNEVIVMQNYLLGKGVPEEDIFTDHAGFSTYESMYRAEAIFGVRRAVVVTQRYHEYRAIYIGRMLGLELVGIHAEDIYYSGQLYREIREILARDKDFVKCIFKPEPTYLGESFDIKGDGRKTWY